MRVYGIAAVGRQGQIGLKNSMPWYDRADLRHFKTTTQGNVVVLGANTFDSAFQDIPVWEDRMVLKMSRDRTYIYDEGRLVGYWLPGPTGIISKLHMKRIQVWIAGGAQIYQLWQPYIQRWVITMSEYEGEADTWMPHLWEGRRNSHS